MVGADGSTELWRHPSSSIFIAYLFMSRVTSFAENGFESSWAAVVVQLAKQLF